MPKPLILCVDDEKSILDSLEYQLQSEFNSEFTIELAESAEEGLVILEEAMANQVEIPVILADYLMPGMKGDQLLIWAHDKMPETRNIMLTGQAGLEAVVTTINHANLYRYIAKPWEKNDLILTVKEAVTSFRQQKTIQSQNADLQRINQTLEDQVAERTRELERQKAFFQQIFENSPDGILIFDAGLKILEINAAFETIFQYTAFEAKDSPLLDLIIPMELREDYARSFKTVLSGQIVIQETQCHRKDGALFPASLIAYPMIAGGEQRGGVMVYRDLTVQRETTDLIRRSYERQRRSNFFNKLITGKEDIQDDIYVQAKLLEIDLKCSFLVMLLILTNWDRPAILAEQDEEMSARMLMDRVIDWLSDKPGIYAWGTQEGIGIIGTLPENHQEELEIEKRIAGELLKTLVKNFPGLGMTLGLAEYRPEIKFFAERYKHTRLAAVIGSRLRPGNSVHHYWDIGAFPLLAKLTDDEESEGFLKRTIEKLLQYDNTKGTSLFPTLERILAHENLRTVADEMFLHYKTILFRKQSIEKILGVSLDSFEGRTLVGTAMALYYFREIKYKL